MNEHLQQQLIKDLLIESFESLDRFDREMLALEKGEGGAETLNNVFRIIHTIKGSSGCIGLNKIEAVAHVGESLLSLLRDGKLTLNPPDGQRACSSIPMRSRKCSAASNKPASKATADYSALLQKLQGAASRGLTRSGAGDRRFRLVRRGAGSRPAPVSRGA